MGHMSFILNIKVEDQGQPVQDTNEAGIYATAWLESQGFTLEGYFASGKADWFYIGGRFTDLLDGVSAVRYTGQPKVLKVCEEHAQKNEYLSTGGDDEANLDEGDWIVVVDYHL